MSGGVDSSVAAKVLVDRGCEVLGVTMRLWAAEPPAAEPARIGERGGLAPAAEPEGGAQAASGRARADCGGPAPNEQPAGCGGSEDAEDAARIARRLGIPHKAVGCEVAFERDVVEPFCRAYLEGKTPNPCVECNRRLKFGALQRLRGELGFDYVATGHYARCVWSGERGRYLLLRGADASKDQSYFLYHLGQDALAHTLFPVGERTKAEIREAARACGLEVADKPESQDICFVEDGDYAAFIERRLGRPLAPGPIRNARGEVLGTHAGLARYTIGQRKGLGVAYREPLFVLAKDPAENALVVGTAAEQGVREIWADDVNLIAVDDLSEYAEVQVKAMYRQRPAAARARVERGEGGRAVLHAVLDEPIRACAPGQALVAYDGDVVVGGGTIVRAR